MNIGLDISGGDFAPLNPLTGAELSFQIIEPDDKLFLFGSEQDFDKANIHSWPDGQFELVACSDRIGMNESPSTSFYAKKDAPIPKGFKFLKESKIDVFTGAGNSGAMMAGAYYSLKTISGIIRPASAVMVPQFEGGFSILLDVGTNPDARSDVLFQYGIIGAAYAEYVQNKEKPRVALLNIGEEAKKGNLVVQAAYQLMQEDPPFNFVGNIEGRDLFQNKSDVIVTDGFTGNVAIKQMQAVYALLKKKNINDDFFDRFNYEIYGGSPILGINAPVVVGHGISSPLAFQNMIRLAKTITLAKLPERIKNLLEKNQ